MTHPDFRMVLIQAPETLAACDVCTQFCAIGEPRLRTFIGDAPQSDLCTDCATTAGKLMRASRIPAESKLRVEAVA